MDTSQQNAAQLSVIMPIYNERCTLRAVVEAVLAQPCVKELICIDDCSNDGSRELLLALAEVNPKMIVLLHERNKGKGASLRTGIRHASANFTLFQDADLEYDPADYAALIAPLRARTADAVYGSRFRRHARYQGAYRAHRVINWLLTALSNRFTGLRLTDVETCYKVFRTDMLSGLPLREDGFTIDPEITAKLVRSRCRIHEVPISYRGRAFSEGKKITWMDGIKAVICIVRYGLWH